MFQQLNAAYCDEVSRIEEKVIRVKEERRWDKQVDMSVTVIVGNFHLIN